MHLMKLHQVEFEILVYFKRLLKRSFDYTYVLRNIALIISHKVVYYNFEKHILY